MTDAIGNPCGYSGFAGMRLTHSLPSEKSIVALPRLRIIIALFHKRSCLTDPAVFATLLLFVIATGCSKEAVVEQSIVAQRTPTSSGDLGKNVSFIFNHFQGGVLFTDVEFGLEILWQASFKNNNAYKETIGLFVHDGLLIVPNLQNGVGYGKLCALPLQLIEGKLVVNFQNSCIEVLGIIHTHPDRNSLREPTPRNDYQYCYLGLHNYVMDNWHLLDAYKTGGREEFRILGERNDYSVLPFVTDGRRKVSTSGIHSSF